MLIGEGEIVMSRDSCPLYGMSKAYTRQRHAWSWCWLERERMSCHVTHVLCMWCLRHTPDNGMNVVDADRKGEIVMSCDSCHLFGMSKAYTRQRHECSWCWLERERLSCHVTHVISMACLRHTPDNGMNIVNADWRGRDCHVVWLMSSLWHV